MAREERAAWVGLVVTAIAMAVYAVVLTVRAGSTPIERVDWLSVMIWTIVASIVVSIVVNIVWGSIADAGQPRGTRFADERDREISRMGDRVGQAFMVIAGLGAIALCAVDAAPFWIANTVFAGFVLSSLVGGLARVVAYRRGLA